METPLLHALISPAVKAWALALVLLPVPLLEARAQGAAQTSAVVRSAKAAFVVETVATGLQHPWGLAFLPDGRMLVTERPGRLRIVSREGALSAAVPGLPRVLAQGQGGLLDVALDPAFAQNRLVYLSFAEPREGGRNGTSVARGRLSEDGARLADVSAIFRQQPAHNGGLHFGSRLVFAPDGDLFVTLGDRYTQRDEAQNPANHIGKLVRIRPDGTPAPGNPGASGRAGWLPEIFSIGHRNVQGAAINPATGQIWTAEHAARGGDEVNHPEVGRNYGWPIITYGVDYSGAKIGIGTRREGLEQPLYYWDPSIAPSGMAFYTGDLFPGWRGNVFVGALAGAALAFEQAFLADNLLAVEFEACEGDRIRDVRQGPDGSLYLLTDDQRGKILRLKPADARP